MKKALLLCCILSGWLHITVAQQQKQLKVGLFITLHLDANFNSQGEMINPYSFPKQSVSGLEFYEGCSLAIDSLNKSGIHVSLSVYDLQSKNGNIKSLFTAHVFDSLDMVICQPSGSDFIQLADICREKNIPLINATYPNDGGLKSSPNTFLVNPKFNSHLLVLHNQLAKRGKDNQIIWFKRKNENDERIENIFKQFNSSTNQSLSYKTVLLNQYFSNSDLLPWIDTSKSNILIAGSLDDNFIKQFIHSISAIENKSRIQICGMPNWENIKEIQQKTYSNIPIYYTSGFHIPLNNKWASDFEETFKNVTGVRNAINAYKGYEITFYFVQLLKTYGRNFSAFMSEPRFKVMTDFDFKPIKWNASSTEPDYYENKRIYFLRRLNNVVTVQ